MIVEQALYILVAFLDVFMLGDAVIRPAAMMLGQVSSGSQDLTSPHHRRERRTWTTANARRAKTMNYQQPGSQVVG